MEFQTPYKTVFSLFCLSYEYYLLRAGVARKVAREEDAAVGVTAQGVEALEVTVALSVEHQAVVDLRHEGRVSTAQPCTD